LPRYGRKREAGRMIIPSKYQAQIYHDFEFTNDSLLVEAVAGSGKTHTLVQLAEIMQRAFPARRAVFVAFNKSIADELARRISASNVRAMTLHSAGWSAWRRAGGLEWEPRVDSHKVSGIMREVLSYEENKRFGETTRKLVGYAKGIGLVPSSIMSAAYPEAGYYFKGLVEDSEGAWEQLIDHYGLDEAECDIPLVRKVLARSIELGRETCDFDDMLYMPVIAGVPFDRYDVVLVDEAQDVSGIQMEMISRMAKVGVHNQGGGSCEQAEESSATDNHGGRVIAVGDRFQSIYGFRGAGTDSMDIFQRRFQMKPLPLSVSYRCPVAVVEHARQWVPQIEAREDAPWGYVGLEGTDWAGQAEVALGAPLRSMPESCMPDATILYEAIKGAKLPDWMEGVSKWRGIQDFLPGDAILCRLTRPVVAAAFALIRRRVACHVLGRDIGKDIVDLAKKSKQEWISGMLVWLDQYQAKEEDRLRRKRKFVQAGLLSDRCETLRVFCAELPDDATRTEAVIALVEKLFTDGNGGMAQMVTLSTIHKFKGMEATRVFILDAGLYMPCPWAKGGGWEMQGERNLMYVAATRAKRELRYIKSSDLGVGL
jgi:DNA helicase II / ATP-dependent DNA helicase PcrA